MRVQGGPTQYGLPNNVAGASITTITPLMVVAWGLSYHFNDHCFKVVWLEQKEKE